MKRFSIILLFTFYCLKSFSSPPTRPYYFPGFELKDLLPFSDEDLKIIHENGIKKVEEKFGSSSSIFYIDFSGRVEKSEHFYTSKNKKKLISTVLYTYNSAGQLILKKGAGLEPPTLDSLIYDEKGRLIYYYFATAHTKSKGKWVQEVVDELKLLKSSPEINLLVNSDTSYKSEYYFNTKNECIKVVTGESVDSLFTEKLSETEYLIKSIFRDSVSEAFKIGETALYKNGKVKCITKYERYLGGAIQSVRNYSYNENGNLISITGDNEYREKTLFTYTNLGLRFEEIRIAPYKKEEKVTLIETRYLYK